MAKKPQLQVATAQAFLDLLTEIKRSKEASA